MVRFSIKMFIFTPTRWIKLQKVRGGRESCFQTHIRKRKSSETKLKGEVVNIYISKQDTKRLTQRVFRKM